MGMYDYHWFVMELLQEHKVFEISGDKLRRPQSSGDLNLINLPSPVLPRNDFQDQTQDNTQPLAHTI